MKPVPTLLLAFATPLAGDLPSAVCADGRPCTVVQRHPAGAAHSGKPLEVLQVSHGQADDPERACPHTTYWRVGADLPAVRLLALCNDGYGASGIGEDSVSVKDGRLGLSRYGGSAWRWTEGFSATLDPLALVSSSRGSFHAASPEHESETTADWVKGIWKTTWTSPECGGHSFLRVPKTDHAPPADVPLGTCSARADASGASGFVAWGKPGDVADGRLAALWVGERTLVVDVWDDQVVASADSWVHADHLEVWVDSRSPDQSMSWDCDASTTGVRQWAVDWSGAVHAGVGAGPALPSATVSRHGARHRVVLELPPSVDPSAVTVVFSDAEGAPSSRQERLVATSPVSLKAPHRLGAVTALDATRCAVVERDGQQVFSLVPDLEASLRAGRGLDGR